MNRKILIFLLLAETLAVIAGSIGTVDLNLAFYFHPDVMLYYRPDRGAFMRPIKGVLSSRTMDKTEKERAFQRTSAKKKIDSKISELENSLNSKKRKVDGLSRKISMIKASFYDKENKELLKKNTDFKTAVLSIREKMQKAVKPFEDKKSILIREISELEQEKQEISKAEFYVDFTKPAETEAMINKVISDIRKAIQQIAKKKRLQVVFNSSMFKRDVERNQSLPQGNADYSWIRSLSGTQKNTDKVHPTESIASAVEETFMRSRNPIQDDFFQSFCASEYHDVTVSVVDLLLEKGQLNSGVKSAVRKFLKDKYKKN